MEILIKMVFYMITNKLNKMKHSFALLLLPFLLVGCSPNIVNIHGTPGTRIMELNGEEIGRIDDSGEATITIKDDKYYGMLLSQEPGSTTPIPFALDYHNMNSYLTQFVLPGVIGYFGTLTGLTFSGVSISLMFDEGNSKEDNLFLLTSLLESIPVLAVGAVSALTAIHNKDSSPIQNNFKYDLDQRTNNDLVVSDNVNNSK